MAALPDTYCDNLVALIGVLARVFPEAEGITRYHAIAVDLFKDEGLRERELESAKANFQPWVAAAALKPVETCFWPRVRPFTLLWKHMGDDPLAALSEAGVVDEVGGHVARMAEACSMTSMLGILPPEMRANIAAVADAVGEGGAAADPGALVGRLLSGLS